MIYGVGVLSCLSWLVFFLRCGLTAAGAAPIGRADAEVGQAGTPEHRAPHIAVKKKERKKERKKKDSCESVVSFSLSLLWGRFLCLISGGLEPSRPN